MYADKVQVKVFASSPISVESYIPVFHRWIRDNVLNELLIDVVDYSHVPNGPEVVLLGHAADYVLDREGGRLGLLYSAKRVPATDEGSFLPALRRAITASLLIEKEPGPVPLAFRSDELLIRINDRLRAPNDDAGFRSVEPELKKALDRLYAGSAFELRRVGEPRDLLSIQVRAASAPPLGQLAPRLGNA
ncbi:MAG TPA: hypothetical protein VG937_08995 [Polyangiaceae bacterium]|jgi:hypothetical protein|nr:hypothetical protein [Polyangiaceae bacterium]